MTATATRTTYPINIDFTWTEPNVIPPRCRNPRDIERPGQNHTVYVPMVTADEAPIAFRAVQEERTDKEYRWYEGRLFTPSRPYARQTWDTIPGSPEFPSEVQLNRYNSGGAKLRTETIEEAKASLDELFGRFLIVDDVVWVYTAWEPCYEVETYGSGTGAYLYLTDSSRSRAVEWKFFSATERDEAIAYALSQLGDNASDFWREKIATGATIEVLIPEASTFKPDRVAAWGVREIESYSYLNSSDNRDAFDKASRQMNPASVGRGETGYADYLELAAAALIARAAEVRAEASGK